ncbi:hypothetical protein EAP62_10880 [Salmonella enterica]|nr:hypothetical protein [Salmonella enterica]
MEFKSWWILLDLRRVLAKYQISKVGQIWTTDIQAFQTPRGRGNSLIKLNSVQCMESGLG